MKELRVSGEDTHRNYLFNAWCLLKGHTSLKKPAAESLCIAFQWRLNVQGLKVRETKVRIKRSGGTLITSCYKELIDSLTKWFTLYHMWFIAYYNPYNVQKALKAYLGSGTIFDNWKPFKNDEKCFLIHLTSSFRSQYV